MELKFFKVSITEHINDLQPMFLLKKRTQKTPLAWVIEKSLFIFSKKDVRKDQSSYDLSILWPKMGSVLLMSVDGFRLETCSKINCIQLIIGFTFSSLLICISTGRFFAWADTLIDESFVLKCQRCSNFHFHYSTSLTCYN